MKAARNGKLRPEPSVPKAPAPKTVTITKEQLAGIESRQETLARAQINLNNFVDGIMTGHGHNNVRLTEYDDEKLTLTFTPLAEAKA